MEEKSELQELVADDYIAFKIKKQRTKCYAQLAFLFLFSLRPHSTLPTFVMGLPTLINLTYMLPHRHSQRLLPLHFLILTN